MAEKKTEKIEHEYVIPLRRKYQHVACYKKTPKAIKSVKEFLVKHMKIYDKDLNKIKLDKYVNEYLWARGIKNPPHKIKVKVKKEGGIVRVELVDLPDKLKFKKLREEKLSKEALSKIENKKSLKERMQETMKGGKEKEVSDEEKEVSEEKKKEEKEKIESVKEAGEKMEKDLAKKEKHLAKQGKQDVEKKKEHSKGKYMR